MTAQELCRAGNRTWLAHDFDIRGRCRRCGAVAPTVRLPGRELPEKKEAKP